MDEDWIPLRFIAEEVEVHFEKGRLPLKKPAAPDRFRWRQEELGVVRVIAAWRTYERRGRMTRNMQPAHLRQAAQHGSWGVGRYYFRVQVQDGRVFDIYYDRAPDDASDRLGHWFLWREMQPSASKSRPD
jgi:hypothetical protein